MYTILYTGNRRSWVSSCQSGNIFAVPSERLGPGPDGLTSPRIVCVSVSVHCPRLFGRSTSPDARVSGRTSVDLRVRDVLRENRRSKLTAQLRKQFPLRRHNTDRHPGGGARACNFPPLYHDHDFNSSILRASRLCKPRRLSSQWSGL
jgi:hypothetical protein